MRIIKRTFTLVLTFAVLLAGFSFPELQGKAKAETTAAVGISVPTMSAISQTNFYSLANGCIIFMEMMQS